jgi:dipeptidyl aminopeptidase/acylaminoacyl peptidase
VAVTAPWGSWRSPFTAGLIVGETIGLDQPLWHGDTLYWIEKRPAEGGRQVIVRDTASGPIDCLPAPWNARSRVHEYGGASFTPGGEAIWFVHNDDQGVYRLDPDGTVTPVCVIEHVRFADLQWDKHRHRLLAVAEDHRAGGEPANLLVAIDTRGANAWAVLHRGHDFYSSPALAPGGDRLAWLAWDHPQMPWDGTLLYTADIAPDGALDVIRCVAGAADESVFQPQWSAAGELYCVSDRSGWWNLYRVAPGGVEVVVELDAEFGLPQWVFGMSTWGFAGDGDIIAASCQAGTWRLGKLCTRTGELQRIDLPYTDIHGVRAIGTRVCFIGAAADTLPELVVLTLSTRTTRVIRRSATSAPDAAYVSRPESVRFASRDGEFAYGFFYPPANRDFAGPDNTRPPLLVMSHGGPTVATTGTLSYKIQYWTSRGFAVLDVNYGGSTGYGRAYRQRLDGQWGVIDVADCEAGARYLAQRGDVDGERLLIRGSSAGGYTTLCALTFTRTFHAGASLYGIGDLEALVRDTHKFESRYLDRLVGPYPEMASLYRARSPVHHVAQLACPVIFLQGLEDKVVPPSQAEAMVDALRQKGLAVAYVTFADEQHGFRKAANMRRALEAELYFYGKVLGFAPADTIEPVAIFNR